jgi:hypothetical protein
MHLTIEHHHVIVVVLYCHRANKCGLDIQAARYIIV